jgi:hypothetical protein
MTATLQAKAPVGSMFISPIANPFVGSDPEVFVMNGTKVLPAWEFLPDKGNPLKTWYAHDADTHLTPYFTHQYWDGFQAELALGWAPTCLMFLMCYVQQGLRTIRDEAVKVAPNAKLSLKSVVRVPLSTLRTAMDPHVSLGCAPSLNAYGLKGIEAGNPRQLRYRFAGGHMHFGCTELIKHKNITHVVKMLDAIVGLWSVGAAKSFDHPIRRRYYGMAGEFRRPEHGLEYRVLSNFWLSHPVVFHATWEIARRAVMLALSEYANLWVAPEEMVVEAIQNGDAKIARKLLELNKPIFTWLMASRGWTMGMIDKLFNVGIDGLESIIKDPEDIENNWLLNPGQPTMSCRQEAHSLYTWQGFAATTTKV